VLLALNPLDAHSLLDAAGPVAVFLALFAETGLLLGFFLPGDSLLFTAGVLTATRTGSAGHLPLLPTLLCAGAGALVGAEYNGLEQLNLPRIPIEEGTATTGGIIALVAVLVATLLGALIGGKVGERYHRKVDRAGFDA